MMDSAFVLLLCLVSGHLVESLDPKCAKYATPLEKRTVLASDDKSNLQGQAFKSLSFRANNYGSSKYKLEAAFNGMFELRIEMENGPRPDSVKGGDLNGFYALYRSFITVRADSKKSNSKAALEIWNVYMRKRNSPADPSAHNVVSLNVEFEIGDRQNNQINLIISALKKLSRKEPRTRLPYNYDLYEFLPLQTSFGIYETTKFPFAYPGASPKMIKQKSPCGPIVKVYRFNDSLSISQKQFDEFLKYEKELQAQFPRNGKSMEDNEISSSGDISGDGGDLGRIYMTPTTEHLLFRRLVAEAYIRNPDHKGFSDDSHGGGPLSAFGHEDDMDTYDDYDENGVGVGNVNASAAANDTMDPNDPYSVLLHQKPIYPEEEPAFPEDCVFLFKIHDQLTQRESDRHKTKAGVGVLSSIGIIKTIGIPLAAMVLSGFRCW